MAGLQILQDEGFEALSLRKIADALGVQTPALYWHVANRAELYGLMAEVMLREALAEIDDALEGAAWLIAFGQAIYRLHARRRDAASLVGFVVPTPAVHGDLLAGIVNRLIAGGMEPRQAFVAQSAVMSLTLGWSLFEGNPDVGSLMRERMDVVSAFDASLAALVDGLCSARDRVGVQQAGSGSRQAAASLG
ncbi:MAG: TetR family transcriptional regulator [Sphingomonas bacterium]|nr:TetR family transcriptional regulator [Sphingomonas bacterium]